MLGLGLESVGYSSVKSEHQTQAEGTAVAAPSATVNRILSFGGAALVAALVSLSPQADFFGTAHAAAQAKPANTVRYLYRQSGGFAAADAVTVGWQEAVVTLPGVQEAVASASILGLPDGLYASGFGAAQAALTGRCEKVVRCQSSTAATAAIDGIELATRGGASVVLATASAYGEWALNETLFATGHARSPAALTAQVTLQPVVDTARVNCEASGVSYKRKRSGGVLVVSAESESLTSNHWKGAKGTAPGAAAATAGLNATHYDTGRTALAYGYAQGTLHRQTFPSGAGRATAALDGTAWRVTKADADLVFSASLTSGGAVKVRLARAAISAQASAENTELLRDAAGFGEAAATTTVDVGAERTMLGYGLGVLVEGRASGVVDRTAQSDVVIAANSQAVGVAVKTTPVSASPADALAAVAVWSAYLLYPAGADGSATGVGGMKINDFYPAPEWRTAVVPERVAVVEIDTNEREIIV